MIRLDKLLRYVFNVKVSLYPYWQILGKSKTRDRHLAYFPGKSREKYLSIGIYFIALDFFLKSRSVKKNTDKGFKTFNPHRKFWKQNQKTALGVIFLHIVRFLAYLYWRIEFLLGHMTFMVTLNLKLSRKCIQTLFRIWSNSILNLHYYRRQTRNWSF